MATSWYSPSWRRLCILAAALVLLASACGGEDDSAADETEGGTTETGATGSPSDFSPEVDSVRIGYPLVDPAVLPGKLATDLGYFEKYGVDVEFVAFNGDGQTAQAVASGSIDAMSVGGAIGVSSARLGEPNVMVALLLSEATDMIVASKDITDPQDLVGKRLAVGSFGDDPHVSLLLALEDLGISPDDVTFVQVGAEADRIAALAAGSIDAAPVDQTLEDQMREQGFSILLKLNEAGLNTPRHGLMVPQAFMEENPETTRALVAGMLEGMQTLFEDTEAASEVFAEWAQLDLAEARQRVEDTLPLIESQRCFTQEGEWWTRMKDALAVIDPSLADVDETTLWTTDVVDQLVEDSFAESVGAPC